MQVIARLVLCVVFLFGCATPNRLSKKKPIHHTENGFKNNYLSEKIMNWTSYTNPDNGIIAFGAADLTNKNLVNDGEQVFNIQFFAKKPQDSWATAAIWTGPKYVGGNDSRDMNITPAMGIVEVRRIKQPIKQILLFNFKRG